MSPIVVLIVLVVIIAVVAGGKSKKKASKPALPGKPDWIIGPVINGQSRSPGMPARLIAQGAGGYFDFPTTPDKHAHALVLRNPPPLVNAKELVLRFSVTGGGFVPQQYPDGRPALVSLILQREGDDWSAEGPMEGFRWYSHATVALAAGEFTLTAPIDPAHFKSINGKSGPAAFLATIQQLGSIHVGLGSGGGRSHGVYATQPSRFTLIGLEVR